MADLSKKEIRLLQKLWVRRSPSVGVTETWINISTECGIGKIKNRKVFFDATELINLREHILKIAGVDIDKSGNSDTRIEESKSNRNEKGGRSSPTDSHFLVTSKSSILISGEVCTIPPGSSCRVHKNSLKIEKGRKVVIIENLEAFDYWCSYSLPRGFNDAYAIYRGHDKSRKAIGYWLDKNSDKIQLHCFYDFDPSGIKLALTENIYSSILIPSVTENISDVGIPQRFREQYRDFEFIKRRLGSDSYIVKWFQDNRTAIMQEKLLAHNIDLMAIQIDHLFSLEAYPENELL